jgi:hypothetical protein
MPKVGSKSFSYSPKGRKAAATAKKADMKATSKKPSK